MTRVRFQADADLRQAIVTGAIRRQPELDFRSAHKAGLEGIKDPEVLAIAAQTARVLVTHDRKTIPTEFGQFIMSIKHGIKTWLERTEQRLWCIAKVTCIRGISIQRQSVALEIFQRGLLQCHQGENMRKPDDCCIEGF